MTVGSLCVAGVCAVAALVAVACSVQGLSEKTCNDEKCCGQSCCNEANRWCGCSRDTDCLASDPFCVQGRCSASPAGGGGPKPPACMPACGPNSACPAGFDCSDAGDCVEAFTSCEDGGTAACDFASHCQGGRCVPTCSDFEPCDPRTVCIDGGCRAAPAPPPVCGGDAGREDGSSVDAADSG